LEEHIASIFRFEEIGSANQQASRWLVPPKRRLKLNGLHIVISQNMMLFLEQKLLRNFASVSNNVHTHIRVYYNENVYEQYIENI
jgi:hypothetical protein